VAERAPVLAASEAALVGLARALLDGSPDDVAPRLFGRPALPAMISPAGARVLGDALAHTWPALWRRGGGTAPALGHDGARGRLWERHPPVGLAFSAATLHLLRWLLAIAPSPSPVVARTPRGRRAAPSMSAHDPLTGWPAAPTLGDHVIIYLALAATAGTPAHARIAAHPGVRAAPLAWLGFAGELGRAGAPPAVSFAELVTGAGAIVVESLADDLARRWRAAELAKRTVSDPRQLIALGSAQRHVLDAWLAACDRHARRDLAGFVIDAAAPLLARGLAPAPAALDPTTPLAVRGEARRAAGGLLHAVARWAAWDAEHRGVRFLDDDYREAQRLLARFEPIGAAGSTRAQAWLADLAALAPPAKLGP
jgi:hypothetical protein